MKNSSIIITKSAQTYLANLLYNHNIATGVRIFLNKKYSEPSIEFCYQLTDTDIAIKLSKFNLFLDKESLPFINKAVVDFTLDRMGGKLTIKIPKNENNYDLEYKVKFIIDNELNPILSTHGGFIRLVKVTKEKIAILKFDGGCKGCVSVNLTLQNHVKRILLERLTDLTDIIDLTDHTDNNKAYYK